jgi:hypothetical protein
VSRWLAEPLRIALAPGEVAIRHKQETRIQPALDNQPASLLPALEQALGETPSPRSISVTLSQQLVRQAITPAPGKPLRRSEEIALARATFDAIYGRESADWRISVHNQPPSEGLFAAAIDASFVDALESLLTRHGARHITIGPVLRETVRDLPNRYHGWLACIEPGWMTLLGIFQGKWRHHAVRPCNPDWQAELPDWLAREATALSPAPAATLALRVHGPRSAPPPDIPGWQIIDLGHAPHASGAAALFVN